MDGIRLLDNVIDALTPVVFIVFLGGWVYLLELAIRHVRREGFSSRMKGRAAFLTPLAMMAIMFALFFATNIVTTAAKEQVDAMLSGDVSAVQVDGQPLGAPAQLVSDIRNMDSSAGRYHHSHPTRRFALLLKTAKGDLALDLARDSAEANVYWVFYPGYKTSALDDIGKVTTAALDKR